MNPLRSLERAAGRQRETTQLWLSQDGIALLSCFFHYGGIQLLLICGELGKPFYLLSSLYDLR